MKKSIEILDIYFSKYLKEYNLKAAVILRPKQSLTGGFDYHKQFYGDKIEYVFNKKPFSTYAAMRQSEILLSFNCTATIEAFGWGKKFCIVISQGLRILMIMIK